MVHEKSVFRGNLFRDFSGDDPVAAGSKPGGSGHIDGQRAVDPAFQAAGIAAAQIVTARQDRHPGGSEFSTHSSGHFPGFVKFLTRQGTGMSHRAGNVIEKSISLK